MMYAYTHTFLEAVGYWFLVLERPFGLGLAEDFVENRSNLALR